MKSWKSFTICVRFFFFFRFVFIFDKLFILYLRVVETLTVIDITVFIIIEERNEGENKPYLFIYAYI